MQLLRYLFSVNWAGICAAIVAGLVCGVANAYLVTLINGVVSPMPRPDSQTHFIVTALVVVVAGLVSQVLLIRLAQNAVYIFRAKLSSGIVSAPLEHLERLGMHRLIATLTEDVRSLSQAASAIPMMCIDLATVVGCLVYLWCISGPIFAITVGATIVTIAMVETFLKRVRRLFRAARENEDALLHSFQAVTTGIKELKLHRGRREDFMDRHLLGTARTLRDQNVDAGSRFSYAQGFGQIFQLGTMAFVLFAMAQMLRLPHEVMFGYVLITTFLAMPMQNVMHRIPDLLRGDVALKKIQAMSLSMEAAHDEAALPYTERPAVDSARLVLSGVGYTYLTDGAPGPMGNDGGPLGPPPGGPPHRPGRPAPGRPAPGRPAPGGHGLDHNGPDGFGARPDVNGLDYGSGRPRPGRRGGRDGASPRGFGGHPPQPFAGPGGPGRPGAFPPPPGSEQPDGFSLGPLDMAFEPGQVTFVVGGNGSGKSTLAKLITGLYVPREGTITLNGEQISHDNVEWFRQNSAAVFTDFHLFEDYLGFLRPGIDDEVRRLLERLQIAHKVTVHDGRLSTIALSQGQRKRLALLTALLEDRPIYLFDEWAADQEPQFRDLFYDEILTELKRRGKTVVVITHDDRYFDRADQLIKLDVGRIVAGAVVEGAVAD
ncbi:ATP-binding cassette domain-containing protein [Tsukamurella soli]|uniref:ATP-binding cassette transporter n=1 Tax=Tsukamurella soli TaxID=644556 RepID=A0ABP8KAN3_9ACTN